jgi:hypothetical protein
MITNSTLTIEQHLFEVQLETIVDIIIHQLSI